VKAVHAGRLLLLVLLLGVAAPLGAVEVVVCGSLEQARLQPLLDRFTQESGDTIRYVQDAPDRLAEHLCATDGAPQADMVWLSDLGLLRGLQAAGMLRALDVPLLRSRVPASYRDPGGYWYGLSLRARVLLYVRARVLAAELSSYEALAEPQWHGRLCVRTAAHPDSRLLVAVLLARWGNERTVEWARGIMANLARPPEDRDPLPALIAGICDVALADMSHYAHLRLSERIDEQVAARQLGMVWPDQEGWGAVLNLSAVAILRQARQPEAAQRFLLFMADEAMQQRLAVAMDEYPVGLGIPLPGNLVDLGAFKADLHGLAAPGQQPDAVQRIFQQAGWR